MHTPAVSVIIPTYNRAGLMVEALDSVAAQTHRDFEVIVVDDGSTEDIAARAAAHATRPRVIRQDRGGPAKARNRGLADARAAIVAFLDSDDLWLPTKLERFLAALATPGGPRIWYGPMNPIDDRRRPVRGRTKDCFEGDITERLFCKSFVHVPTVVCDRSLIVEAGGFDESLPVCEDYDLWLRLSAKRPFGLVAEPLSLRRLHGGRLSKADMSRNVAVKARMLERFYRSAAGTAKLDRAVAEARLARVYLAAARAAFFSADYAEAAALCARARQYGGSPLRAGPIGLMARLLGRFAGRSSSAARKEPTDCNPSASRA
jgi:glycosyltransferase involved in cell wall biosynthesis